ncbi:MAG: glucose-6-phosphate dehydrogenase [Capsulimonadales bacterium]|nr:glucose-6-phosphate dehydrogenase [Capsulimonadales bacterium]
MPARTSCAFVLFGATGDLTRRKLLPALFRLYCEKLLPANFAIVGFALPHSEKPDYHDFVRWSLKEFVAESDKSGTALDEFVALTSFVAANFTDADGYERLAEELLRVEKERSTFGNRLFYMATPPALVPDILGHLDRTQLTTPSATQTPWTRIIAEKPFGIDRESAKRLTEQFHKVVAEDQVFRIDHYLGKDAVQDVSVLRFANSLFEPLWNRGYVDQVQITVAETLGVERRGAYFDPMGQTRDMVQSHALQVLALLAMEPPNSFAAKAIREEKSKVLESMRPLTAYYAVRGQYGPGYDASGEGVSGYRQEPGIPPESNTETYMAARLFIESWRWSGVPFYVRAGKRLPRQVTEVNIIFKGAPLTLFRSSTRKPEPNRLRLRIQPDAEIALVVELKRPGTMNDLIPIELDMYYQETFQTPLKDAYERLLLDALNGDAVLFMREDEIDAAWRVVDPLLAYWRSEPADFPNYAAGTWGPEAADELLARDGRKWIL